MFSVETNDGRPLTQELAELRARMEPLIEVAQRLQGISPVPVVLTFAFPALMCSLVFVLGTFDKSWRINDLNKEK